MNIKTLIAVVITALLVTPLAADDDSRKPARWRGSYFVDDDVREDDFRERIRDERKWREELDKRERERAREWEKRERERIKELEKLEIKRREEWEKFQRERAEQLREAPPRVRARWEHGWDDVGEREEFWRYQRRPRDPWRAPPALRYEQRFRDRDPWFEDDFDSDLPEFEPPFIDRRRRGDGRSQHYWESPWDTHQPQFGGLYRRPDYDDDDDDDDDD